jgi:F-type H+-transporting ATPase subunit b
MKTRRTRLVRRVAAAAVALGIGLVGALGFAQPQPGGLPQGHPPMPGFPPSGQQPNVRPLPGGPGGTRQIPPDAINRRRPSTHVAHEEEGGGHHGEAHCPGHGPDDAPHWDKINWWHGMIAVNNEKAQAGGFLNQLLWRYDNHENPCDEKNEPPPFLAAVLNFGVLAFVLYRFGKKPVGEALLKRKQSIMSEIDNASQLKREAEKRLREYEERFEKIESTLAALKAEYASQAQLEKKHILAEAEERRTRMKRDAEFRIEQELKAARIELLREAVQGSTAAAEEMIRKRAAQADYDRMAEDYLSTVRTAFSAASANGGRT